MTMHYWAIRLIKAIHTLPVFEGPFSASVSQGPFIVKCIFSDDAD